MLAACSPSPNSNPPGEPTAKATPTSYTTITWDKLMPEGAYEALDQEQAEYMSDLSNKLMQNAQSLYNRGKDDKIDKIEEGSPLDYMPQLGTFDIVESMDGQHIRIPGYVVPLEFGAADRSFREFLFVPSQGACIHAPPPPPNQVIYVKSEKALKVENTDLPYWLKGTLRAERKDHSLASAAYAFDLEELSPYPVMQ